MGNLDGLTFLEESGRFFNKKTSNEAENTATGEVLYLTRHKHFILFTPEQGGDPIIPEKYSEVSDTEGVCWLSANGYENLIIQWMIDKIDGYER